RVLSDGMRGSGVPCGTPKMSVGTQEYSSSRRIERVFTQVAQTECRLSPGGAEVVSQGRKPCLLPTSHRTTMTTQLTGQAWFTEERCVHGCPGRPAAVGRADVRLGGLGRPAADAAAGRVGGRDRRPSAEAVHADLRLERAAGIRAAGPAPDDCCWVDVGDRGSDIYQAMRAGRAVGHHFLFRAKQDRVVFVTPAHDRQRHLFDYARSLPGRGRDTVNIPGRGGRPPRTAVVELAGAAVWVPAPKGFPRVDRPPVLAARVIRIWEPQPPAGVEPLEWVLLCSLPGDTPEDLKERRDWYGFRWLVEVFH